MVKRFVGILIPLLLFVMSIHAQTYRTFTDSQLRTIEARILSYDTATGKFQIERKSDRKRFWVMPENFSKYNQDYFNEWIAANQILSEKNLEVTMSKERIMVIENGMDRSDGQGWNPDVPPSKGEMIRYEVTLRNRSPKPIENLKIEYRYFKNIEYVDVGEEDHIQPSAMATMLVKQIKPGGTFTFQLGPEEIVTVYSVTEIRVPNANTTDYDYEKISEDEFLGVWLKVYGPKIDGVPSVRDVTEPKKLQEELNWDGEPRSE
jgi:hypothetical protein